MNFNKLYILLMTEAKNKEINGKFAANMDYETGSSVGIVKYPNGTLTGLGKQITVSKTPNVKISLPNKTAKNTIIKAIKPIKNGDILSVSHTDKNLLDGGTSTTKAAQKGNIFVFKGSRDFKLEKK